MMQPMQTAPTQTMRVLIADDELLARKRLARLLGSMEGIAIAGECASGDAVVARVKEGDVDVVLLDVHMPGLTGLEAAPLFPEDGPIVVLCTAHPDHAVEAFEIGAADYVLKPVEAARLKKALARARAQLAARSQAKRRSPRKRRAIRRARSRASRSRRAKGSCCSIRRR